MSFIPPTTAAAINLWAARAAKHFCCCAAAYSYSPSNWSLTFKESLEPDW